MNDIQSKRIQKEDSSKILLNYNSYMHSEEESGCLEPENPRTKHSKHGEMTKIIPEQQKISSKPQIPEELGLGSMQLLQKILKEYKHCVK